MSKKSDVLESWIMVEHLSEGDINLNDKSIITLSNLGDENYYDLFIREIQKKKMKKYQQGGIVVFFDIFSFKEIIDFLRKEYNLLETEEDIKVGNKFSFALYFDKELKIHSEMTFISENIEKYHENQNFHRLNKNIERYLMRYLNVLMKWIMWIISTMQ